MRRSVHFTYRRPNCKVELQQGDILRRTPALDRLIREIHPYYMKSDYTHFMVLTQTCDLVKRDDGYGTAYIAIGAIRPLATVIKREMQKFKQNPAFERADAIGERNKDRARYFLRNLMNNNNHEYFYLHEQVPGGLTDRCCVFLRLAVPVKVEHYDTIKAARVLSLKPAFQAKLGWLVGYIYARVGTDDWVPTQLSASEWDALIEDIMREHIVTFNERKVQFVRKNNSAEVIETWSIEEARQRVNAAPEFKIRDEVIEIVTKELVEAELLAPEALSKAVSLLKANPVLKTRIRG